MAARIVALAAVAVGFGGGGGEKEEGGAGGGVPLSGGGEETGAVGARFLTLLV